MTSISRQTRPWSRTLWLPLALAFALRLALIPLAPAAPAWDGVIYARAAEQLAFGEGYTQRILRADAQPYATAFYPVGFPAVLAFVRLLGGSLLADQLLQVLASSLLVPLSMLFARRAHGARAGRYAAWICALWPGGIFLSATWLAEPVFALALGFSLLPLLYARRRTRLRAAVLSGLGLGLVAYLRPSSLPMAGLLGVGLGFWWARGKPLRARSLAALSLSAGLLALACLPLAPWAYRNQRKLGAPVLVSTNGGVNLLLGTRGEGDYAEIGPDEECKRGGLREVERDRCFQRRALAAIASDPVAWLGRGVLKVVHTFGHDSAPAQCFAAGLTLAEPAQTQWRLWSLALCRLSWLFILAASIAGAVAQIRRGSRVMSVILLAPIAALALLHATYLGGDRYHAAVAPMLLALAGVGAARWWVRSGSAGRSDTPATDRAAVQTSSNP